MNFDMLGGMCGSRGHSVQSYVCIRTRFDSFAAATSKIQFFGCQWTRHSERVHFIVVLRLDGVHAADDLGAHHHHQAQFHRICADAADATVKLSPHIGSTLIKSRAMVEISMMRRMGFDSTLLKVDAEGQNTASSPRTGLRDEMSHQIVMEPTVVFGDWDCASFEWHTIEVVW